MSPAKTHRVAILTLPAFNELDSFVALSILNRASGVTAFLAGPVARATSMNGVETAIAGSMADLEAADAVIVGSGRRTREFVADAEFMAHLGLDPSRQLVASQCSGALILARLGLLAGLPVCTDNATRPDVERLGLTVTGRSLSVAGSIATAGGCLSGQYLATWLLLRLVGEPETRRALDYVVPVGEAEAYASMLIDHVRAADATFAR